MGAGDEAEERLRAAATVWTGIKVDAVRFEERIAAATAATGLAMAELNTNDLYLVAGCLARDDAAIALFERHVISAIRPAVERACRDAKSSVEDIVQWTREKLLLGEDGSPPKLAQYTGRGSLTAWVRVVAVREALQDRRRTGRERPVDDTSLLEGSSSDNVELKFLRKRYGDAFRTAVQQAMRKLDTEQRTILRLHTHEGLTIDQLGPMLGVHRATAARRLEKARADALVHVRAILRAEHGLSESEARSLCIALAKEVDVSLGRALAEEQPT